MLDHSNFLPLRLSQTSGNFCTTPLSTKNPCALTQTDSWDPTPSRIPRTSASVSDEGMQDFIAQSLLKCALLECARGYILLIRLSGLTSPNLWLPLRSQEQLVSMVKKSSLSSRPPTVLSRNASPSVSLLKLVWIAFISVGRSHSNATWEPVRLIS